MHKLHRRSHNRMSFDISTCKLWYALVLLNRGHYQFCLRIVDEMLSSVPPYALYFDGCSFCGSGVSKLLYGNKYVGPENVSQKKVTSAWMFELRFPQDLAAGNLPLAIKIELNFCDDILGVQHSPFTCAYYLMFLCYHVLQQDEDRDWALCQLIVAVNNPYQREDHRYHSYNIAGHCLLLAGQIHHARVMFLRSYQCNNPL